MTLLERVASHLATEGVPHAVIGAAALAAAGISRSTFDVDLLTTDRRILDAAFWRPLRAADLSIEVRRGDLDDPLAGIVRLQAAGERPVDVVVGRHEWQARAVARARTGVGPAPVVAPSDLVLLKLYAGGTQDLWDIRELLALPESTVLVAQVEAELAGLPAEMRERWLEARR